MNLIANLALTLSRQESALFSKLSRLSFDWIKIIHDLAAQTNKIAANTVSLVGVDGTTLLGKLTPISSNSHVHTVYNRWPVQSNKKVYVEGPETFGLTVCFRIQKTLSELYATGVSDFILIGYSRGGHIALEVAKIIERENENRRLVFELLQESKRQRGLTGVGSQTPMVVTEGLTIGPFRPIRIRAVGLFDAVDRELFYTTQKIPSIVENTFHAIRSPTVDSRSSFGNTGLVQSGGWYESKIFTATHAGMGGLPWTGDHPIKSVGINPIGLPLYIASPKLAHTFNMDPIKIEYTITEAEDRLASSAVFEWMWPRLQRHMLITEAPRARILGTPLGNYA